MNIGLIGNGHLGKAFVSRLNTVNFNGDLLISKGRGKNTDLIRRSDLVILMVRPLQLAELAQEIRGKLAGTRVISFTAATPKLALEASLEHPVARAMADIQFEQVLAEKGEGSFLQMLSQNPLIEVDDEKILDSHTIFIGCLPGVIAWQMVHNRDGAMDWIQKYFYFIQEKLGISETVLHNILGRGLLDKDPAATVQRVATPGGITESLLQQLERNPHSSVEELYEAAWARTTQVRAAVAQSFKA